MTTGKRQSTGDLESGWGPSAFGPGPRPTRSKPRLERLERIRLELINRLVLAAALGAVAYIPMLVWQVWDAGWYTLLKINGCFVVGALVAAALQHCTNNCRRRSNPC